MVSPRSLKIAGNDGSTLHATLWPNSGQPVCILLHGFGHDNRIWDPLAIALQAHFEVVALDFRGHGDSSWDSERRYGHNALQEDLETLVKHLDLRHFHLVGHSLGARVAMLYTAREPQLVQSLTIIDTGPEAGNEGVNRIRADAESLPRHFDQRQDYFQWLCNRHPLANRERLQHMAAHGLRADGSRWQPKTDPEFVTTLWQQDINGVGSCDLRHDLTQQLWDALDRTRCKTLVLRGQISSILKHDIAVDMVENRLAQGELESAPMAGHAVLLDNPEYCISSISAFLARASSTAAADRGNYSQSNSG